MRSKTLIDKLSQHEHNVADLRRRVAAGHMRSAGVNEELTTLANELTDIQSEMNAPRKPREPKATVRAESE